MGSLRLTLCTGFLAATALITPAAHAADGGGVAVTPSSPVPGSDVALKVGGCTAGSGRAVSTAFTADVRLTGTAGTLMGAARLSTSVEAGTYDIKVSCGDVSRTGTLTVVRQPTPAPYASPVAPVHAGGGGTAHLADSQAAAKGPGTAHAVTGLVLAGVAAVAVAVRSSRRRRGSD
ncbi:hypothetical protein ACIPSE_05915 [Streptomyces sp. NPDC090106]|uniref:hypothetical protein n=1 Tax=Streptomyces sp. NPDC090106 TaxID=3365946 RepID=UPI0037FA97FB